MDRYRWNILGLCEMKWKNFGERTTQEGHKVLFSGKENRHKHGNGFLVHNDIMNTVMGCCPVSFNITKVQVYAPTSDYNDRAIEKHQDKLQNVIYQTSMKDILVMQRDWNAKVGKDAHENCQGIVDPSAMMKQRR